MDDTTAGTNHDTIIRHECEIGELRAQGDMILDRKSVV